MSAATDTLADVSDLAELRSRRRRLIWSGLLYGLVTVVAVAGLVIVGFSANNRGWNDESRVVQTRGVVAEEVDGRGSCKGADFDTRLEWTQDSEVRTAWTNTCRSGPDVGDEVDLWVRDDGEIVLTDPGATNVFIVVGVLFFIGLGVFVLFSVRSNLRTVNEQLATPQGCGSQPT